VGRAIRAPRTGFDVSPSTTRTLAGGGADGSGQVGGTPEGTFVQVTAGQFHACGVRTDGTAECWGSNDSGQLAVPAEETFVGRAVTVGGSHACAARADGTVACWGDNEHGQADPPSGTFMQLAGGGDHTCGLRTEGTVTCWGLNDEGQLDATPHTFRQITSGVQHTCGIRTDGLLACWGSDSFGQVSSAPAGTFKQISAGFAHNCGVKSDGTLACWGYSDDGLGSPPAGTFVQTASGQQHSCGVKTDGTLACWGDLSLGQGPVPGNFTQLTASGHTTCGVKADGALTCWGPGILAPDTPEGNFTQVGVGGNHACALTTAGTATCWGSNNVGQLGGSPEFTSPAPGDGTVGVPYSHTYTATGGPASRFFLTSGALPPGVTLNGVTGALQGTPTAAGTFTGDVTASNEFFEPDDVQQLLVNPTVAFLLLLGGLTNIGGWRRGALAFPAAFHGFADRVVVGCVHGRHSLITRDRVFYHNSRLIANDRCHLPILTYADKCRVPQQPVLGPTSVLDLDDHGRTQP
jgi:alpha-tubulin suppressor-like RCC1 family protein